MKKAALILTFALLASTAASTVVYADSIVGSKHDLKTWITAGTKEVCVFCHTPHQVTTTTDPLWNHTLSTVTSYGVYASSTLNATPSSINGAVVAAGDTSALCLSCHDGTVAPTSMYNSPNSTTVTARAVLTGTLSLGTDLTNDHPVNFLYSDSSADGELKAETDIPSGWLVGSKVQCQSCHNVHDPANAPFLNTNNINSNLCTTCHSK